MPLEQSYTTTAAGSPGGGGGVSTEQPSQYWSLSRLRRAFTDYVSNKREEIEEQKEARRYYHGSQWTEEQIRTLRKRKQPVMTFNRFSRKVDGATGTVTGQKQDPKAFPRTPMHEELAEIGTASLRYVCDTADFQTKAVNCVREGFVDGIAGVEMMLIQGDRGDPDISLQDVDLMSFFYDPRSYKEDFSDARYMGIAKWLDEEEAREMYPDASEDAFSQDFEMLSDSDREHRWFRNEGATRQVCVVEIWYKHAGGWCYAHFSGMEVLQEGKSYFQDEKGKDICKYIMFSAYVDQDGDRYGLHRNLKSPQDAINATRSKFQHMLGSNKLFVGRGGAGLDVEKVRAEWARPDGVIVVPGEVGTDVKADDKTVDLAGWDKFYQTSTAEMENFGPNQALVGEGGVENSSGRAIALLQRAGMAELGSFITNFKGWKLRVYRAIWNALRMHWKTERWIRVTDDDQLAQFIQVNAVGFDPNTGTTTIINNLGVLDVDIIIDEGPDTINMAADNYETMQALASNGAVPPQILLELAPLQNSVKSKIKEQMAQAAQSQPQPVDPSVAKLEQAKMDGQIRLMELEQTGALKQKEMAQNAYFKQQEMDQEAAFTQQKQANEIAASRHKMECDMQMSRERNDHDMQAAHAKHQVDMEISLNKINSENQAKAAGAESQAAPFAKLADKLVKSIDGLAAKVDESADEIKAALAAPRKIDIQRDAKGNVTGGQSVVNGT